MNTLEMPKDLTDFLTDFGFKSNGNDFYKSYLLTNFKEEWEEEIYVSLTNEGYKVWYPNSESKNKLYKQKKGLINYIANNHS